ncbi:MAG: hypothetical protein LCH35_05570 [Bacteroidetes bacterium]|jgi:hypothetical protein|uniref:hypothetical protein n=1 Tax=Flavobacterium sp. TaxID=239 RepID=UPI002FDAA027|nr:hypothetical protein [Bacteroidota bacterium]
MKPTFKQIIFLVFFFVGIQFSVSATSNPTTPQNETILLKKLQSKVLGNDSEYLFSYNDKKITKIDYTTFDGVTRKGYFKFTYSGDLITKIQEFTTENVNLFTSTFTYTNGQLAGVVTEEIGKNKAEKINFIHNGTASVTAARSIGTSSQQNNIVENEVMYFTDNKLVKKVENGVVSSSTIYEYDRANNPLQNVIGMDKINVYLNTSFGIFSSSGLEGIQNNRVKQTVYTSKGTLEYVLVFNTTYTDVNFPNTRMSPPNSPGAFEYNYKY